MLSSGGMEPWVDEASLEPAMLCHAVPCYARSTCYVLYITTDALFSPCPTDTFPLLLAGWFCFILYWQFTLNTVSLCVFFKSGMLHSPCTAGVDSRKGVDSYVLPPC